MALLELKDITKTYQMGEVALQALDHISLQIDRKEFVAITGFSGSGKSTLMHVMGCLDTPTSGSYHIDGTDVSKMDTGALAQIRNTHIGFVFQRFYLLPDLTALDNVALPQLYAGKGEPQARAAAQEMLERVG